jgi:hypothetical protein
MCALAWVPRFWTVVCFHSASERGAALALWEAVADDAQGADMTDAARGGFTEINVVMRRDDIKSGI